MLLEPDPPMPLDQALRYADNVIAAGSGLMLPARAVRALRDYIEVLELETGKRRQLPTQAELRASWGPPPPVERIEVQR
jgi:hypothetical protein